MWPCHQINVCMSSPNLHVFLMLLLKLKQLFNEHNKRWHFWNWRFEEWWAFKAFTHNFFPFFPCIFCVCGSKKFFICWIIHSIYKITTCAHLVGYCPFLVLFFKSFSLFPLYSKGWIYFKDFDICNLSLETKIHNAGKKKNKHNVQLNLNIKWSSINILLTHVTWIGEFFCHKKIYSSNIDYLSM